jgi:hypothetical protein
MIKKYPGIAYSAIKEFNHKDKIKNLHTLGLVDPFKHETRMRINAMRKGSFEEIIERKVSHTRSQYHIDD